MVGNRKAWLITITGRVAPGRKQAYSGLHVHYERQLLPSTVAVPRNQASGGEDASAHARLAHISTRLIMLKYGLMCVVTPALLLVSLEPVQQRDQVHESTMTP